MSKVFGFSRLDSWNTVTANVYQKPKKEWLRWLEMLSIAPKDSRLAIDVEDERL